MARPPIEVDGLREFRRELRALTGDSTWTRALGQANRTVAADAAVWAQMEALGMGGVWAHFAGAIAGRASATEARLQITREANAAFWGAQNRTGWNAGNEGRPQHPEWVSNSWDVAVAGQGPYALNEALADNVDEIIDLFGDALDDLARQAFPD